ncbi:MAG TPA: YebC/PmpR family DNA-binding transcriptional regulator [Candidatus Paceibacterota bacterium]|nr:YebC/PmpR family DNA-binding transcriptional regulator [Candidatus Paceibacterota bacterium]
MSGHSKWSQIKRQKESTDAKKSKLFSKHARFITVESKKSNGVMNPSLQAAIDNAKKDNVPKDVIERAVKKGTETGGEAMESITYESYGPGGVAIIIEALTSNRNKAAQEVKHILSKHGSALAASGSASWAFTRENMEWIPNMTVPLSDEDLVILEKLVDELEDNEEVQDVFTNAE